MNESCYGVLMETHGVRDSGFGLMLQVRASSVRGMGSLRLKSSCSDNFDKIVQCDREEHVYEIDERDDCFDTIAGIVDKVESSSQAGYLIEQHTMAGNRAWANSRALGWELCSLGARYPSP